MFCTNLTKLPNNSRPMSLQETDEEGNMWFISSNDSTKNMEIDKDNRVQLYFCNSSNYEYLSVYGIATIHTDKQTIEDKWSVFANAWFDGKDDPNVSIIKVQPSEVYYWDTKAGKLVSLLSFAKAIITGDNTSNDDGVEGSIKIAQAKN